MKKLFFNFIYILLIVFPVICYAEGIENYYINAILEEDGDLRVREYFNMTGEYNGAIREINYRNSEAYTFNPDLESYGGSTLHNGTNIIINEIRAVKVNSKFDFTNVKGDKFKKVESADKGDYGVYTTAIGTDGYTYTIYLPDNEEKAFYIDYTISNIAIVHNDIAELGWNVFNDNTSENISNLEITVTFPNNQNEFRVWAHGPLNGVVTPENKNTLKASITDLRAYRAVDVRATFDKTVIPYSTKTTNVDALQKILNYEEDKAEQANYERQQMDLRNQEIAQEEILACYDYLSRYCYESAASAVDKILDQTKKAELTKQLEELNILVTKKEEETAEYSVQYAEETIEYMWYEDALENVEILTNEELKQDLLARLEVVQEKIEEKEISNYQTFKKYLYGLIAGIIGLIVYVYLNHDREYQTAFNVPYLREIPNHYSPTTVSYLFNRKITEDAISAEILSLINKKILISTKIEKKGKDDYELQKNKEYKGPITEKENKLLKLVLNGKNSTTMSEMKKKASSSYRSFINRWEDVMRHSINEALDEEIYVDDINTKYKKNANTTSIASIILYVIAFFLIITTIFMLPGIILIIFANKIGVKNKKYIETKKDKGKTFAIILFSIIIIGCIITMITTSVTFHFIENTFVLPLVSIIICIVGIIYTSLTKKRTESGNYEYARWRAFKRFLLDFGKMDIKEIQEVKLWNDYLVYAIVLGCADKVEKAMKLRIKDLGLDESTIFTVSYRDFSTNINRGIKASHNNAVSSLAAHTSSSSGSSGGGSWSSGGGGGGGFSSGGGSFGGGGSVGRF